jgi:hypothetical protein
MQMKLVFLILGFFECVCNAWLMRKAFVTPMDLKNFDIDILQKIDYIHENPVRAGLVEYPEHYIHSSATDYNGKNGLLPVTVI